ncbi:MAG TPA: hypothetical protein VJK04_00585 [Candidatus Paceibacterota bacterium]
MKQRTFLIVFLGLIFTGIVAYGIVSRGHFPIMFVNGKMVTERAYEQSILAVVNYYMAAGKTYQRLNIEDVLNNKDEVRKLALEQLVENAIINQELRKRLGSSLETVVQQKLVDVKKNQDFSKAASAIYGLKFEDFVNLFMRPIAERELLDGKLLLEKSDVDTWLKNAKASARVTMLISNYFWSDGSVKSR